MGIDEMGVDKVGVDKVGRHLSQDPTLTSVCPAVRVIFLALCHNPGLQQITRTIITGIYDQKRSQIQDMIMPYKFFIE